MEGEQTVEVTDNIKMQWAAQISSPQQEQTQKFLEQSKTKLLNDFKMFAFFNKKLVRNIIREFFVPAHLTFHYFQDVNRFFDNTVEVGSGPDMPQVEQKKDSLGDNGEKDDLFEEHLEDALCVFKSGGVNSDIIKQNEKQIMFFLDLENEEIIEKEQAKEVSDGDEKIGGMHPVLFNQYPICKDHCLLLLFAFEGLPQALSDELL